MLLAVRRIFPALLCATLLWSMAEAASYRVQPGDSLIGIAARSGVSAAQLRAANPRRLANTTQVQTGWVLVIPARQLSATSHTVREGQNLTTIARKYGVTLAQLLKVNPQYRGGKNVWVGAVLHIPARTAHSGGSGSPTIRMASTSARPVSTPDPTSSGWTWPLRGYHTISSGFGGREFGGGEEVHYGVDIPAPEGTPVRAARAGRVLESRPDYGRGWGWTVVIQHPDGWITRYAHLSANLIKKGELVVRGQRIGRVGSTGRSTGPHLHFGTYLNWHPRNPLNLY